MADLKPGQIKVPDGIELLASEARADASYTGDAVPGWRGVAAMIFVLDLTAEDAGAGDTLDVSVETSFDNDTWINIFGFTRMSGATTPAYQVKLLHSMERVAAGGLAEFDNATSAARPIFGSSFRALATIADGGGNHKFTFSVKAYPLLGGIAPGQE